MRLTLFLFSTLILAAAHGHPERTPDYLPTGEAERFLTVEKGGKPEQNLVVLTESVAVKETGPKQTVARFGEVYAFSPSFLKRSWCWPSLATASCRAALPMR